RRAAEGHRRLGGRGAVAAGGGSGGDRAEGRSVEDVVFPEHEVAAVDGAIVVEVAGGPVVAGKDVVLPLHEVAAVNDQVEVGVAVDGEAGDGLAGRQAQAGAGVVGGVGDADRISQGVVVRRIGLCQAAGDAADAVPGVV